MENNIKMRNEEWRIGIVEFVGDGVISFSAEKTDIDDRISDGQILRLKGVNDFVYTKIDISSYLLMKVIKVKSGTYDTSYDPNKLLAVNKVSFIAEPLGILENGQYISGAVQFPMVGATIFGVTSKILNMFFSSVGDNLINMGTVNNYPTVKPDLNLLNLLTSHIAIIGNTGSGKSTTLRVLIDRINGIEDKLTPLFKLFVFDVHGDYSELAFAQHINVSEMHLQLENLNVNDWAAALLPSERTQKPILTRALAIARIKDTKRMYAILAKKALEDTSQESFALLKRMVTRWYKKAGGNEEILDKWILNYGNESDPLAVINEMETIIKGGPATLNDLIKEDEQNTFDLDQLEEAFDIVFGEEEVQGNRRSRLNSETMMARFRTLKYRYGGENGILNPMHGEALTLRSTAKTSKFFVINLTSLDDDALRLVSNFLARSAFRLNVEASRNKRETMPFNYLYLDEAHRYVQNSLDDENTIFDTIAREGRKFNVYLGVISQIPSELSRVVLAQVGAYFIHRIQNSVDLDYIRKNVPAASIGMVARLPILPAGTALLSGTAFDVPFELRVDAGKYGAASNSLSPLNGDSNP